jgi:hypothetical protein
MFDEAPIHWPFVAMREDENGGRDRPFNVARINLIGNAAQRGRHVTAWPVLAKGYDRHRFGLGKGGLQMRLAMRPVAS